MGDLLSAPVPAACRLKAGRLVNGVEPGIPEDHGYMELASSLQGAAARTKLTAFGDLRGSGARDAAAVLDCSAGGVSWPQIIAFYSPGPALLGWAYLTDFNLPGIDGQQNTAVQQISYRSGGIAAEWSTQDNGDAAAVSSLDYSAILRLSGSKVTASQLTGTTELPTVTAFLGDLRHGNEAAAARYAAPSLVAVTAAQFQNYPSALAAAPKCYGDNDFSMPAQVTPLVEPGGPSQVSPLPDRVCVLASTDPGANWIVLGMSHAGFRKWQVLWVRAI
jgi:hypothetical protein